MSLSHEEVRHVARLSRLRLTDEEVDRMRDQLDHIIDQFAVLQQLDTSAVPPTAQVFVATNTLRDDIAAPATPVGEILASAPRREGDLFRVRGVLDE